MTDHVQRPLLEGSMTARITKRRLADANNAVLQVVGGSFAYRREPCGGCPWRIDQTGAFPAEAFRISAPTAYDASLETFACHESGPAKPAVCAGFLLRNSLHNIGARLKGIAGGADCRSDVDLHPSYRAMAVANGVSADDPIIARCRADDEVAPMIPIAEQIAAVRLASQTHTKGPVFSERMAEHAAALRAAVESLEQHEGALAVVAAARGAWRAFTADGERLPVFRTDEHLPEGYWSPSGRMTDTAAMVPIRDALAAFDTARREGEDG